MMKSGLKSRKLASRIAHRASRAASRSNSKLKTQNSKLPFLFINMAITADCKIATANRAISSFGSRRDKEHLLELPATADAVMAGARTVDLNRINLGPGPVKYRRRRIRRGLAEY